MAKTADVVGLYVDPPVKTIVLCVDEKPWIQALQRAQGYLKLPNGRAYAPHGSCGVRSRIHRDRAGSSSAIRPPPHRSALWSHERSISRWIAHGDLNASNRIESLPMLVDWEYAQLADPVYDLACLSVYYPGLRLRVGELLGVAGITDANATVRLRLHAELFESLNRLWEQAQASRQA